MSELHEAPNFEAQSEAAHLALQRGEEFEQEIRLRYEEFRDQLPVSPVTKRALDLAYEFGRLAIIKHEFGKLDYIRIAQRRQWRRTSRLTDSEQDPYAKEEGS